MGLPKKVVIYEVGPREGFQIEDQSSSYRRQS